MSETIAIKVLLNGREFILIGKKKEYKTGSRGYFIFGKVEDRDGKRYQIAGNMIEIGSKAFKE